MSNEKIVLAYSGGLDTSVAIKWLQEKYDVDVVAVAVDVGQPEDLPRIQNKALTLGAIDSLIMDAKEEFARDYIGPAIQANAVYERKYPLPTALARPLIAKKLVEAARRHEATAVAHGCTGKGNDQVRFDVAIGALAPDLRIVAPQREWSMTRDQEIDYARQQGIEIPVTKSSPYSIDENMYGRSIEAGALEDPWIEPPPDVWRWTNEPAQRPADPEYIDLELAGGLPCRIDGREVGLTAAINILNEAGGRHGIGRIDMVEDRLVGIKSREAYECPAATILLAAHRELESLVLPRELIRFKYLIEDAFADQVYNGLWFSPLRRSLSAFIRETQPAVGGTVRLRLHQGNCTVVGRKSDLSLYDLALSTYEGADEFSHGSAEGFIELFGLPTRIWAKRHGGAG